MNPDYRDARDYRDDRDARDYRDDRDARDGRGSSYYSRDRDWREKERDVHVPTRDRERDRERDRYRPRSPDLIWGHRSRSRSPPEWPRQDRSSRAPSSQPSSAKTPSTKTAKTPSSTAKTPFTAKTPRDPRIRAKGSIYEATTSSIPDKAVQTERIMSSVMPRISAEASVSSPETRLAALVKQLIQAAVDERVYRSRKEDTKKALERHNMDQRKLGSLKQFPTVALFQEREIAQHEALLQESESLLDAAEKRAKSVPKEIADEIMKLHGLPAPKAAPSSLKLPPDFETRFEALEKAVSQQKEAMAPEAKSRNERIASLEVANKTLQDTATSFEEKARLLEKSNAALEERVKQEEMERTKLRLQLLSVEKLVQGNQSETHVVKQEIDNQQPLMELVRERLRDEAASALSKDEVASLKKMARGGPAALPDLNNVEKDIAGLKAFDTQLVGMFGAMVDKLRADFNKLVERVDSTRMTGSGGDELLRTELQQLARKVHKVEGELQAIIPHAMAASDMKVVKAQVGELAGMAGGLKSQIDAHDMQIGSLDNRWNNIYTKEFAERVIGNIEKFYPNAQQIQQGIREINGRLVKVEAQLQQAELGQGQGQAADRRRKTFSNADQNLQQQQQQQ